MKIGLLYNCQGEGIARALELLLPGSTAVSFHLAHVRENPVRQAQCLEVYRGCDHVIISHQQSNAAQFGIPLLRGIVRNLHVLPPLSFRGFHPDMTYVTAPNGEHLQSATGAYHSRIAIAAFLAGLAPQDAALLYNAMIFRRLGYLRAYDEDFVMLPQYFAKQGIDAAEMIAALRASGAFMHSMNHPKIGALGEMARLACRLLGERTADVPLDGLRDELANDPSHPVFPIIARAACVKPEGDFRAGVVPGDTPKAMALDEFLNISFELYKTYDRAVLHESDGVAAANDVIGAA